MQESRIANERTMRVDGLRVRLADRGRRIEIGTPRSTITDAAGPLEKRTASSEPRLRIAAEADHTALQRSLHGDTARKTSGEIAMEVGPVRRPADRHIE